MKVFLVAAGYGIGFGVVAVGVLLFCEFLGASVANANGYAGVAAGIYAAVGWRIAWRIAH